MRLEKIGKFWLEAEAEGLCKIEECSGMVRIIRVGQRHDQGWMPVIARIVPYGDFMGGHISYYYEVPSGCFVAELAHGGWQYEEGRVLK